MYLANLVRYIGRKILDGLFSKSLMLNHLLGSSERRTLVKWHLQIRRNLARIFRCYVYAPRTTKLETMCSHSSFH